MGSVRDRYIEILEKRAAEAAGPDYSVDSQAAANAELGSNKGDQRAQLEPLLKATKATEKEETKQMGQLLPKAKKDPNTTTSDPMLKVAMHTAFFDGLRRTEILKMAEIPYIRTAFRSFENELEKIGVLLGMR